MSTGSRVRSALTRQSNRMRHSAAHIMAEAVLEMFPEAKFAIGPPIDTGFYYDFELPGSAVAARPGWPLRLPVAGRVDTAELTPVRRAGDDGLRSEPISI